MALAKIMISGGISCAFCLMNLGIIILLLVFLLLKPERFIKDKIWQGLSVCFLMAIVTALFIVPPLNYRHNVTSIFNKNDAVANVGGHSITAFEMEQQISDRLYQLENKLYDVKKKNLEKLIQMKLIGLEAEKKEPPLMLFWMRYLVITRIRLGTTKLMPTIIPIKNGLTIRDKVLKNLKNSLKRT